MPGEINGHDVLQANVLNLMSTLHGYIFTIDIDEMNFTVLRCELEMMLTELDIPVLILCCSSDTNGENFDLDHFATEMNLSQISDERPWAAFKVNAGNMKGVEKAFAWILHHLQYEKNVCSE